MISRTARWLGRTFSSWHDLGENAFDVENVSPYRAGAASIKNKWLWGIFEEDRSHHRELQDPCSCECLPEVSPRDGPGSRHGRLYR